MSHSTNHAFRRTLALTGLAFLIGLLVAVVVPEYLLSGPVPPSTTPPAPAQGAPPLTILLQVKLFFSTFSTLLLIVLFVSYAKIYQALPNRFTLSLMLFSVALTLYAVTANPLVSILFGFRLAGGGPFTFLPDLFTAVEVTILLYQSYR